MGLFSSKKITYVSSSVWNMAGDFNDRTNYLRYLLSTSYLTGSNSLAGSISDGTRYGPSYNAGMFFRWARNHYSQGIPQGGFIGEGSINPASIASQITPTAGWLVQVAYANIGSTDFMKWAEKHVYLNIPDKIETNWTAQYNSNGSITVLFPDMTTSTFWPDNFIDKQRYIYIRYNEVKSGSGGMVATNTESTIGPLPSEPVMTDYEEWGTPVTKSKPYSLDVVTEVTVEYSDSTPPEYDTDTVTSSTTVTVDTEPYRKFENSFWEGDTKYFLYNVRGLYKFPVVTSTVVEDTVVEDIGDGVTKTTTTKVTTESLSTSVFEYYYTTQNFKLQVESATRDKFWFYRIGSGNGYLDSLANGTTVIDGFFPVFPLRIDNVAITDPTMAGYFPPVEKAFKKAVSGGSIHDTLHQLHTNPNINDIDFAFMTYGVPLNTRSRDCKRYIMEFLDSMVTMQSGTLGEFETIVANNAAWMSWYNDQVDGVYSGGYDEHGDPLPPEPAPNSGVRYPSLNSVTLRCNNYPYNSFNQRIEWSFIQRTVHAGRYLSLGTGDLSLEHSGDFQLVPDTAVVTETTNGSRTDYYGGIKVPLYYIRYQFSDTSYIQYKIYGMEHINEVYNGVSVTTNLSQAFGDDEESGFFFPLHYSTLKRMPVTKQNQVQLESQLLVLNCYTVVKQKWYQRGAFKIILVIASIAVAVLFPPAGGLGSSAGFLGTNAAVGAMVGATGMAGAIIGAAANAIAGMIVLSIVEGAVGKLLGPQFAALFSTIFMVGFSSGMFTSGGFNFDYNIFLKAENVLKLTNAAVSAYTTTINLKTQEISKQIGELESNYKSELSSIQDLFQQLGGMTNGFDPMALTEVLASTSESSDSFMYRTLLTGSDIAEITNGMISNLGDTTLNLDLLK